MRAALIQMKASMKREENHDRAEELLQEADELRLAELHLLADEPEEKAAALAHILDAPMRNSAVTVGETLVRFLPGGPQGRPELHGELFL